MLALLAALLLTAGPAMAQSSSDERYQLVRIEHPSARDIALMRKTDSDHVRRVPGGYEIVLSLRDVEELRRAGVTIVVLIDDLERYYSERAAADIAEMRRSNPDLLDHPLPGVPDFHFGSVAGFYSADEVVGVLRSMAARFPRLASTPFPIGKSVEGEDIMAIRISARPKGDTSAPEVLFTALQHAREPIGMTSAIATAWWLLDGYGTDPEATYLLDHRALYLVPMVNPDGYRFNLGKFPQGGGLWRKNRRPDGGVDLNRNYGPREFWDGGSAGSSDRPSDLTYRGPEPFSEPETRAIRDFCLSRTFRVALNFHSFSNLLIYPFDWLNRVPVDSAMYRVASRELVRENGYAPGSGLMAVGYPSRGIADEWMYAYGTPGNHILSWAPELGSQEEGFWPRITEIVPLVLANAPMNLSALWIAGSCPRITSVERVMAGGEPALKVVIMNIGRDAMDAAATLSVSGDPSDAHVTLPPMVSLESRTVVLPIPRALIASGGARATVHVAITYHGVPLQRTVHPILQPTRVLFQDDFDRGLGRWSTGGWDVEEVEGRGGVLSDSPGQNYQESDVPSVIELRAPISLREAGAADLRFDARWMVQARDHDARVEVRRAADSVWQELDLEYLQVAFDSTTGERSHFRGDEGMWHSFSASLDRFLGDEISIRFLLTAPRSPFRTTFDGVMIDSLRVEATLPPINPALGVGSSAVEPIHGPERFLPRQAPPLAQETPFRLMNLLGQMVCNGRGRSDLERAVSKLPLGYYTLLVARSGAVAAHVMAAGR